MARCICLPHAASLAAAAMVGAIGREGPAVIAASLVIGLFATVGGR